MQINWTAVGVVAVVVLGVGGGATHVFDRLGKLEGRVTHLSPESVQKLKEEIAADLERTRRAVAEANESVRGEAERAVDRIAGKLAEAEKVVPAFPDSPPPTRQWCNVGSQRELNQWYGAYEFDIELSVVLAPQAPDRFLSGGYACGSVVGIRSAQRTQTYMFGGYDFNETKTYQCSATGITIPRGSSYRVTRLPDEGKIIAWAELRPSCPRP